MTSVMDALTHKEREEYLLAFGFTIDQIKRYEFLYSNDEIFSNIYEESYVSDLIFALAIQVKNSREKLKAENMLYIIELMVHNTGSSKRLSEEIIGINNYRDYYDGFMILEKDLNSYLEENREYIWFEAFESFTNQRSIVPIEDLTILEYLFLFEDDEKLECLMQLLYDHNMREYTVNKFIDVLRLVDSKISNPSNSIQELNEVPLEWSLALQ